MDWVWIGGFALLCVPIAGLLWACDHWLAPRPPTRH